MATNKKPTGKQIMALLADQWRMEDAVGLPPKLKRRIKAKLTKQEKEVVSWVLKKARNVGHWGDFFTESYGETEVTVVDNGFQKLDIRVGPVFQDNKISRVPGIWIAYQERAWLSSRQGDFLMSPSTFFEIVKDTLEKLSRFNPSAYKLTKKKLIAALKNASKKARKR